MKRILILAAALVLSVGAASATTGSTSASTATATTQSAANNAGNTQEITLSPSLIIEAAKPLDKTTVDQNINGTQTIDQNVNGTQTLKNVPSVSGPALTTSNDTCMGSSSGSANGPGIGISFGTTWTDTNCKMLKNSRELWNMGMKAAAMALLCKDPDNREALELTGFACPKKKEEEKQPHFSYRRGNE